MGEVVYLTGPPAVGKSTLTRSLLQLLPALEIFEYGSRLTAHLVSKTGESLAQEALRERSSMIVTPEDVRDVDEQLVAFVNEKREAHDVIIDSHPVTKESYGFRITPFKLEHFSKLNPTQIWMLYVHPDTVIERISANPQGRPVPSHYEASFHTDLQASVAITYGMHMGLPVHLFDANIAAGELAKMLAARVARARVAES